MIVWFLLFPVLLIADMNLTNSLKQKEPLNYLSYIIVAPIADYYFKREFEFSAIQTHPLNQMLLEAKNTGKEIEETLNYELQKYIGKRAKLEFPPNMNKIELNLVIKFRLE